MGCNWYRTYCMVTFYFISLPSPSPNFQEMSVGDFLESGRAKTSPMYPKPSFSLGLFFQFPWASLGSLGNLILSHPPLRMQPGVPSVGGRKRWRGPGLQRASRVPAGQVPLLCQRREWAMKRITVCFQPLGQDANSAPPGCLKWAVIRKAA